MSHILSCIRQATRHPRAALLGAREFRLSATTSFDDWDVLGSYDAGRELAHLATARRWDDTK